MHKISLSLFALLFAFSSFGQYKTQLNSSEIYQKIEKLNFLGSVLYIAAHPDDENTKLISYLSNNLHAQTAYLSLTRGDGGQNLIGPEIREALGVIRTQELLAARRIDGGQQFFSRANDFGYSKKPSETFSIWDKEKVLSDVVWAIRKFQPDVIINRFDHRTEGRTHGHHTASARLSKEAFDLADNKNSFPEQLDYFSTWQPKRLFFNTSWWFYGSQEKFEQADKSDMLAIDVGNYYPLLGKSNTEIASLSRSQHKSQGFGNTPVRGKDLEYIELIENKLDTEPTSIFTGINTNWSRVKGGKKIGKRITKILNNYDFKNPSKSIPALVKVYGQIENLENKHWRKIKLKELKEIIASAAGLYLEASTKTAFVTKNDSLKVNIEVTNRNKLDLRIKDVCFDNTKTIKNVHKNLDNNQSYREDVSLKIPEDIEFSSPYWLRQSHSLGMYQVPNLPQRGKAENEATLSAVFNLEIENIPFELKKPVVFKTNDPVKGEVYKPLLLVPKISLGFNTKTLIFKDNTTQKLRVTIKSYADNVSGELRLNHDKKWKVTPESIPISFAKKGEEKTITFEVKPPENHAKNTIEAVFKTKNKSYQQHNAVIEYEHIPQQSILSSAKASLIKLKIEKKGDKIAYIQGAGDKVGESLLQIGYQVSYLQPKEITKQSLENFDAVVIGIRAYNTMKELTYKQNILFDFVKNGGNMIVQYNTTRGLKTSKLSPYRLKLSSHRVTNENANVKFLNPKHPVLNTPNKITNKDFDNWVQERGLYFPDSWSKEFTPIFGMHDSGEKQKDGSLLIAPYGKGYYIYTGLSFFRELPAGVSGAYRLFANLLSLGK